MREFIYAQDLAECCVNLLKMDLSLSLIINIGSREYITIRELAYTIKDIIGYDGKIIFDSDKHEGAMVRKMNLDLMYTLDLIATTSIREGLVKTYNYFLNNISYCRFRNHLSLSKCSISLEIFGTRHIIFRRGNRI